MPSPFGPMTLGEIIDGLEKIAAAPTSAWLGRSGQRSVHIDWNDVVPSGFHSYRGYYDHLAIDFFTDASPPELSDFIKLARDQIGATHTGWKGGEYTMTRDTPVWVAIHGRSAGWGVASIRDDGHCATLITQHFD